MLNIFKVAVLFQSPPFRYAPKNIFAYIKHRLPSGLSNNRIRLWFALLTQSILIRWVETSEAGRIGAAEGIGGRVIFADFSSRMPGKIYRKNSDSPPTPALRISI